MAKANFYMSERDRCVILDVIANYIGMYEDSDTEIDECEYGELIRVREKVRQLYKTKNYTSSVVQDALEIAERLKLEGKI